MELSQAALLVSEGDDGVDAGGAAGGEVASAQDDSHKEGDDADEGQKVDRMHAEEESGHEARGGERAEETDGESRGAEARAFGENLSQDVGALGA